MSESEMARRLKAVRRGLRKAGLDAYLIVDRPNTRYLTGFACSSSFTLITLDEAWFITDFRYIEAAREMIAGFEIVRQKTPKEDLARRIKKSRVRRLGVEKSLPYGMALEFSEAFAPAELAPDNKPIAEVRARKSAQEIRLIRQAVRRTDAVYADLLAEVCGGWTEIEIRNRLRRLIESHGGFAESFDSIVASGPNASKPHAVPGKRAIQPGDMVQIDTGMVLQGYCSDLSRVFSVGRPTRRMRAIHQIVRDAQRRAIEAVRPGLKAKEVDARARRWIERKGYGKNFGHNTGHGVGLEIHEPPSLNPSNEEILREGMVITVEPGIYIPGWGGIRIEDVVAVRKDGVEILTAAPKQILVA